MDKYLVKSIGGEFPNKTYATRPEAVQYAEYIARTASDNVYVGVFELVELYQTQRKWKKVEIPQEEGANNAKNTIT